MTRRSLAVIFQPLGPHSARGLPVFLVLLLASLACRFTAPQAAPVPGSSPRGAPPTPAAPLCRDLPPGDTNSALTQWSEPHIVCAPGESNRRGELFIFLPGTGATPDYYTHLVDAAAEAGLHAIALRYPNDRSANIQICPRDPDDDCHELLRREITQGQGVSENVVVDAANSVEGRLQSALAHLTAQAPAEGWGDFLQGEAIRWDAVVIAGHSQGGGHAVYLAYQHRVHHAIAFAWADVRKGDLAPWLLEQASTTPPGSYYLFWHEGDRSVARYQPALMTALGLDAYGAPAVVDGNTPPYGDAHALIATHPAPDGQLAHNTHVADVALVFDPDGIPIYKAAWQYLLTLEMSTAASATQIPLNAVRMGASPPGYIDPEFSSALDLVTFADAEMHSWLAALDPQTGDFVSSDGRDILVDRGLTPLRVSFNAPEFGLDANGWALYYTRDVSGIPQIFRATLSGEGVTAEALTDDSITRLSVLATKNPLLDGTRLLYAYGGFSPDEGSIGWLDEADPLASETIVAAIDRGARWIEGTASFTFVRDGQAVVYDTGTQTARTATGTPGEKTYAYGWLAPETGTMLLLTIVDDARLEIYAEGGAPAWDLISTLDIPSGSAYSIIGSPEAFTAGGRSYITLVVKAGTGYAPAEVWVWGIEGGAGRFTLRCEDGQGAAIRSDPETYLGAHQVYVYYNLITQGAAAQGFELYRCETGLRP